MNQIKPFSDFIQDFRDQLKYLFHVRSDIDRLSTKRGLPPFLLREIMSSQPLAACIPSQYGGRGGNIAEGLELLSAASYESLPLSLGFGINWALFLQPLAKYGREEVKPGIFSNFIKQGKMGGLMITEPGYGSDALHMQTAYTEAEDHYHLQGTKHWGGLTGWADYWMLTARRRNDAGNLAREIDFFICDVSDPEQHIEVEEYYENLGVYMLPYGRNRIDVRIPKRQKLIPHSTGLRMMLDLLHRSRMQFPGMGMGFLQRLLDEAVSHCKRRQVGGRSLFSYDQVQQRLSRLQAAYTISSAMCLNSSSKASLENDLSGSGLEANSVKTYLTDLMQASAQSLLQLVGAKGYRLDHIAGRSIVDSRPFQIFEGSNDILYIQIAEVIQKQMQRRKEPNLLRFLQTHELTSLACGNEATGSPARQLHSLLDFEVQSPLSQRRLTELGQIISRVVAADLVLNLARRDFQQALIQGALSYIVQELSGLIGSYRSGDPSSYIENYQEGSKWIDFV